MTVSPEDIRDVVALVGAFEAEESVTIQPETSGVVASIEFQEGERVKAGTLLFRLRDREERARLAEGEANLALAANESRRAETLRSKQSVSEAELERARAQLEIASARRDQLRVELERTEIRAPFDGVLGSRMVSIGDRVARETNLVRIDAVDRLRLLFTLPEVALALARIGTPVEVTVVPYPNETFKGEVYFVAPTLDPRNRRALVKATVPNPDGKLRPGLFANIKAQIAHHAEAIVVPETAIAYDLQGPYVWRVGKDDKAERVSVELGIRQQGRVEIVKGLQTGDRVVAVGTHKVNPGAVVQQAPPPQAPPASRS